MSSLELPPNAGDNSEFDFIENLSIDLSETPEVHAPGLLNEIGLTTKIDDPDLVKQILGVKDDLKATPGREYFYQRATAEADGLVKAMQDIAEQNGIVVPQEAVDNWQPDENETKLLNNKLVDEHKQLQIMDGIGAYNDGIEDLRRGTQLRQHQNKTLEAVDDFLEATPADQDGSKIALIQLPTAAGKSGIIAKVAEAAKFKEDPDEPVKVLVLEPTQQLVDQIVGEGRDTGFNKFAPDLKVGRYFQDAKDTAADVTSMCNSSFNLLAAKGQLPEADIIIADEAHMLGPTTQTNLESYREGKVTLGLTATPSKAKEMFGEPIVEMNLREGIQDYGILAPVRRAELLEAVPIIDYEDLPQDDYSRQAEIREAKFKARLEVAIPKIADAVERGLGVVVRCPPGDDIDYAKRTAAALRETTFNSAQGNENIRAIEVGGSEQRTVLGKKVKNLALDMFNAGEIHVVTHVKQIGVGSDLPRAKLYVDLDSTSNSDTVIQNFGRVLRQFEAPDPNNPNKTIQVPAESLEFVDHDLGDKQCTVLKVLRLEHGEPLTYDPVKVVKKPLKTPTARVKEADVVLKGVKSRLLDVESVEAKQKPERSFPDGLDIKGAAEWFGVSPPTFKTIMREMDIFDAETLGAEEMELITLYHPELVIDPLPENRSDLLSIPEVMELANMSDTKPDMFTRMLQLRGLLPKRYRTDTGVQKFFSRKELVEFLNK